MLMINDCRYHLVQAGIAMPDADQLRRIAMTLHRWHELECGDSNDYASQCVVRGKLVRERIKTEQGLNVRKDTFEYDDNGAAYLEIHPYNANGARYERIADRERGAQKRLAKIMARYPGFQAYVQSDPRGAALYILRPGDVKEGDDVSSCYSRGIAVYK